MTKPIPDGAPRQRQARVCISCRTSKVKCNGAELPDGDEGLAIKACERCVKSSTTCEFTRNKRMGRPRRLPKELESKPADDSENGNVEDVHEAEDSEEDGVSALVGEIYASAAVERLVGTTSPSSSLDSATPSSTVLSSYSTPETAASSPPSSVASTQTTNLAVRYLQEVHPWLPILPTSISFLLSHFECGHASMNFSFALTTLLSAPTPFPITFNSIQLSPTIHDAQAALMLFAYLYGMGEKERARPFLSWVSETIKFREWHLPAKEKEGHEREMARRLFWEASAFEIVTAVTSGVRDLSIQELNPTTTVTSEDLAIYGNTAFVCQVRALSLFRDLTDPFIKPTPQEYGTVVKIAQTLVNECEQLFNTSRIGVDLTGLGIEERATLEALDEQAFWAFLIASSSLVNLLCSTSSLASSGFDCGSDYTTVLTNGFPLVAAMDQLSLATTIVDSRDIIHETCLNTFKFLKAAFATSFGNRSHSPSYACIIMIGSLGLIASPRPHFAAGTVPPSIDRLSVGESGNLLRDHVDFAQVMLEDQRRKWPNADRVAKGLRMMQVVWFVAPPSPEAQQEAKELVTSFQSA